MEGDNETHTAESQVEKEESFTHSAESQVEMAETAAISHIMDAQVAAQVAAQGANEDDAAANTDMATGQNHEVVTNMATGQNHEVVGGLVQFYEAFVLNNLPADPPPPLETEAPGSTHRCFSPTACEKRWHSSLRGRRAQDYRVFVALLVFVVLGTSILPLVVTGETSLREAESTCRERLAEVLSARFESEANMSGKEWKFDNMAQRYLLPAHFFNMASTTVSSFGFVVWLYCSPHMERDIDLDRKLGTYVIIRLLGNVLVNGAAVWRCSTSPIVFGVMQTIDLVSTFGFAMLTNLLCHRYLLEKASTLTRLFQTNRNDSAPPWLEKLGISLRWEMRSQLLTLGILTRFIDARVSHAFGILFCLMSFITDGVFSVLVTVIFLRPIVGVMREMQETNAGN
jgi:hypothetical protein